MSRQLDLFFSTILCLNVDEDDNELKNLAIRSRIRLRVIMVRASK